MEIPGPALKGGWGRPGPSYREEGRGRPKGKGSARPDAKGKEQEGQAQPKSAGGEGQAQKRERGRPAPAKKNGIYMFHTFKICGSTGPGVGAIESKL